MITRPNRREFSAFVLSALAGQAGAWARAQDPKGEPQPKADTQVAELKGPDPIPQVTLLPTLKTTPVRKGSPSPNIQMVDASLLPRDRQGIWVLDFAFKPLRMRTVEVPGRGRRQIHYLYYRVVNHTGKPREFVPQFTVLTDTGKRYEESVLPKAVPIIKEREDGSVPLLGAVDIAGVIPPSTRAGVDDAVFGVALWDGIDPRADRMSIYVRGLSDGYQETTPTAGGKPVIKYKTLRIDLIRRGDEHNLNEKEIELNEPAYEWIYW
ncbi:MAG: hypothetical protein U0835_24550 [Isosphaeraceae bacterium]